MKLSKNCGKDVDILKSQVIHIFFTELHHFLSTDFSAYLKVKKHIFTILTGPMIITKYYSNIKTLRVKEMIHDF